MHAYIRTPPAAIPSSRRLDTVLADRDGNSTSATGNIAAESKGMRARIELGRVFAIELRLHCSWPMPRHSNLHLVGMIARSGVFQMLQSRLDLNAG